MNVVRIAVSAGSALLVVGSLQAQQPPQRASGVAVRHDVSPALRNVVLPPPAQRGVNREVPLRVVPDFGRPANKPGPVDPRLQAFEFPEASAALTPALSLVFEGLSDDDNASVVGYRVVPPDTNGDIGPDDYVQWVNSIFQIWSISRDGDGTPTAATSEFPTPLPGNAIWAGFGGPCETNNDGDPIVLYDHLADRWMLSQFSVGEGIQCVAVSTTGDPAGSYHRWAFVVSPGENNDYPKFGMMPNAYYLSLRDFPSGDGTLATAVAFDRLAMLAGSPSPTWIKFSMPCSSGNCPDGVQPPHLEGTAPPLGTPGIFSRAWDDNFDGPLTGSDGYRLWEFVPDFTTPGNSTFTELPFVGGAPYDSNMCGFFARNCVQQASSPGTRLDPIDELQMYRAQYRHFGDRDSLLINTTVDVGDDRAGIRWAELRNTGSGWTVFQEGTYGPDDGHSRWMGSAAMDEAGNIALGYSVSSSTLDPSIRYVTRTESDTPGTLPGGEVEIQAGLGAQTQANRWGDYSSMSVDPVAPCTFWYTQEYYANTGSWDFKTKIAAFQMDPADCNVTPPVCGNGVVEGAEQCDDSNLNGATCSGNGCSGGSVSCTASCTLDYSACTGCGGPTCGDGVCESGENCTTCALDCPSIPIPGGECGNGICETGAGEDCLSCPNDCAGLQSKQPSGRFCCGDGDGQNPVFCSDARCNNNGFVCIEDEVPPIGETCCGLNGCESPWEDSTVCSLDCTGSPVCDDVGNSCVSDADCCSNKCRGPSGRKTCKSL